MSRFAYTVFGADDVPITSLPWEVQCCINTPRCGLGQGGSCAAGGSNTCCPSTSQFCNLVGQPCDQVMTNFCNDPAYAQMSYCACINAPTPDAACFFAQCTNSAYAYPLRSGAGQNAACPSGETICTQIQVVGGSQNVVQNVVQQCGTIYNIYNTIRANPLLAVLVLILLVLLGYLLAARGARPERPGPAGRAAGGRSQGGGPA